jgi:hypothetical protein
MMDEVCTDLAPAGEDRHFQSVESQIGGQLISDLAADDLAGKQVGDKRGTGETAGRHTGFQVEAASGQHTGRRADAYSEPQRGPGADHRADARC